MKKSSSLFVGVLGLLCSTSLFAGNPAEELSFVKNNKRMPDLVYQSELRQSKVWKNFLANNGTWYVMFNEGNGKPHRAYGQPVSVPGATPRDRALNFISSNLKDFNIDLAQLEYLRGSEALSSTSKHDHVNFYQSYKGLKVEGSRMTVKMDKLGRVIMFGADVFDNIKISTTAAISESAAIDAAKAGLSSITSASANPILSVLPISENKSTDFRLVYTLNVKTFSDGIPGDFYVLVDANTGELLYRQNNVKFNHGRAKKAKVAVVPATVRVQGTVSFESPIVPAELRGLPNLEVVIDGTSYYTDANGDVAADITGAGAATVSLSGKWVEVRNQSQAGAVPTMNQVFLPGANTADFDNTASLVERSAYYSTNTIHDFHKEILPAFTGMDKTVPANVDITPATCNAFYDGSSINFYLGSPTCVSLAVVSDVIYHEYGHGINDTYYSDMSATFRNGAMGEGYADVWGFAVNLDPILADGSNPQNPSYNFRRYDQEPKVYPKDIIGEVHADGEIIAGAWWDTYVNLGNDMAKTMSLFAAQYAGLQAVAFNGEEGQAFVDVLVDVLQADDDDANLANGTPNGVAISSAFRRHGITLISNAEIVHTPIVSSIGNQDITLSAELILENQFDQYLESVYAYYATNVSTTWVPLKMTTTDNTNYTGVIPAVSNGTLIRYYLAARDNFGSLAAVQPISANEPDPNVPNYTLVGFNLIGVDDMDNDFGRFGDWTARLPGDNATTGKWEFAQPVGTFGTQGDPSTAVAPYYQSTPGGDYCYVTGNSSNSGEAIGTNDVDAGRTSLLTPEINLTTYTNPTFTYNRWYTNNPPSGANPNADFWQVQISNDGTTWKYVENTKSSDRSYRRVALRVRDYVTLTDKVSLRFVASDSLRPGQNLDGGSLVEAAIDDLTLYEADNYSTGIEDVSKIVSNVSLFPNPSAGEITVVMNAIRNGDTEIVVQNLVGEIVYSSAQTAVKGANNFVLPLQHLPSGMYLVNVSSGEQNVAKKFSIIH